jgi:hypothetical protein
MEELSVVRIKKLTTPDREFDGTADVKRVPRVGDLGILVHKSGDLHIVEAVDDNGLTIWLADFSQDELEEVVFSR